MMAVWRHGRMSRSVEHGGILVRKGEKSHDGAKVDAVFYKK
jgi:hypothetical protein